MTKPIKKQCSGFSILEVVFSIALISICFVTLFSLFSYNLKLEIRNRNKIIASYLAQEALEVVRQKRDDNWFLGEDWMKGMDVNGKKMVIVNNNVNQFYEGWSLVDFNVANNNSKVFLLSPSAVSAGGYVQPVNGAVTNGSETVFSRSVQITKDDTNDNLVKVEVIVNYGSENVVLTTFLHNGWY